MSASGTEAVMVCHQSGNSQGRNRTGCRYGTQSRGSERHETAGSVLPSLVFARDAANAVRYFLPSDPGNDNGMSG